MAAKVGEPNQADTGASCWLVKGIEEDSVYRRNNKSNGVRNLLCFPKCCDTEHSEKGWCGNEITGILRISSR